METLLDFRESVKDFYGKYDVSEKKIVYFFRGPAFLECIRKCSLFF